MTSQLVAELNQLFAGTEYQHIGYLTVGMVFEPVGNDKPSPSDEELREHRRLVSQAVVKAMNRKKW